MTIEEDQARQAANAELATAQHWLQLLQNFVITTDEEQEQVASMLRDVKARYKEIENRRTEITQPLNQALRAINNLFRPPRERFQELEKSLKQKIATYLETKQAANVAALTAASQASTSTQAQQALSVVAPIEAPRGVNVRYVWRFELSDEAAVPREFCSPDARKIQEYLSTLQGEPAIPGIVFHREPIVTSRSR